MIDAELLALRAAKDLCIMTGKTHHAITIPAGSVAYEAGYRYATCPADELDYYVDHGAEIITLRRGNTAV